MAIININLNNIKYKFEQYYDNDLNILRRNSNAKQYNRRNRGGYRGRGGNRNRCCGGDLYCCDAYCSGNRD